MSTNFPPQTGEYLVKVKSGQSTDTWSKFSVARCQISVGQDYHEGAKLEAMIDWCANRFDHVQICVNDTLQRFNIMFEEGLSEDKARDVAQKSGNNWIWRNLPAWGSKDNVSIAQWDEWLDSNYASARLKTDFLYAANITFRQAIDENLMEIWSRRQRIKPNLYTPENFVRFAKLSRQYLLEEITAFSTMYEKREAIDIYPGTAIFAATVFQGQEVDNAPSGLGKGHFCRIDFSKNKNYEPPLQTPSGYLMPDPQRAYG